MPDESVVLDVVVVGAGQAGLGVTIIWRGPAWLGWK
jgi:cation diffusion facilitator CzcD-associated flavoprotein CzcO